MILFITQIIRLFFYATESLGTNHGALPSRDLVFQLVCRFHRYGGQNSMSTVLPKKESCFQDGACSVGFLLHSPLLMLLPHSMSIIHRDILHPDSPTSNLGERHQTKFDVQSLCTKFIVHCKIESTKQNHQGNYNNGKYSFPQITLHPS